MHILLIHQAFAALDEAGGTRHHELARYLVQQGHQVTVITSSVSYLTGKTRSGMSSWIEKQIDDSGVTILRTYTYSALHRSFVHRIFSFLSFMVSSFIAGLRVRRVDLLWGTSPPIFQGVTAWLLARLKRVPFLFEVRDLWPAFAIGVGILQNPLLISASLWLERFLYKHADQLIVNSPGYIEHVSQRGAGAVALIPNGADLDMFDPEADGSSYRGQVGGEGKFIALYAGAHGMSNDLGIVLESAQILHNDPNILFVFIGDGKEKTTLQKQAADMHLSNVHFLPPVPKSEMKYALAAADVCIAILKPIDLYKTTFPNKVFDYMAAARPVVLAIDGVIRQVVEEAGAGLFAQPGSPQALAQAIQTLASQPDLCCKMGQDGRLYIEQHYNRAQLAERLAHLMEAMTSTSS